MKIHLDELLENLRKELLHMANMVSESITYATSALYEKDSKLAQTVLERENAVDTMENILDEEVLKIFALQQPIAVDLRFVVMVLKMNNDFERIGDLAVNVSERVMDFIANDYYGLYDELVNYQELRYMATKTNEMIKLVLKSIIDKDVNTAREVLKLEDLIDSYNKALILKSIAEISHRPEKSAFFVSLISISKYLEQVGDHASSIAQGIFYMVEGRNIKHQEVS